MHIVKKPIYFDFLIYSDCAYQLCTIQYILVPDTPMGVPPTPLQTFLPRAHCGSIFVWSIYLINLLWERLSARAQYIKLHLYTFYTLSNVCLAGFVNSNNAKYWSIFRPAPFFTLSLIHVAYTGKMV